MLLEKCEIQKKALRRVAGQPADEVRVLPAPTQEKEEDLTNSIIRSYLAQGGLLEKTALARKLRNF